MSRMEPGQCDAFYNESFYFEDPQNTVAKNPIQERVVAALEGGNPPLAKELHEHFSLHPLSDLDKAAVADALQSHALYLRSLEDQHVALPPEYSHLTSDDFMDGGEIAESATYFANYWRREESINNSEPSPGHPDTPEQAPGRRGYGRDDRAARRSDRWPPRCRRAPLHPWRPRGHRRNSRTRRGKKLFVTGDVRCANFLAAGDFHCDNLRVASALYGSREAGSSWANTATGKLWLYGNHDFELGDSSFAEEHDLTLLKPSHHNEAQPLPESHQLSAAAILLAVERPRAYYEDGGPEVKESDWWKLLMSNGVARARSH